MLLKTYGEYKLSNKLDYLIDFLNKNGFEVQKTSYRYLIESPELNYLKNIELPNIDSVKILKYFPDLFVIHKSAEPSKAPFFIVLVEGEISKDILNTYYNYFPKELAVMSIDNKNNVYAKWLLDESEPKPFKIFLSEIIGQ